MCADVIRSIFQPEMSFSVHFQVLHFLVLHFQRPRLAGGLCPDQLEKLKRSLYLLCWEGVGIKKGTRKRGWGKGAGMEVTEG